MAKTKIKLISKTIFIILLTPTAFLAFHAFLFSVWYAKNDLLFATVLVGSFTLMLFSFRVSKWIHFPKLKREFVENDEESSSATILKKDIVLADFFEILLWYIFIVLVYLYLWKFHGFPETADNWRAILLGYVMFFTGSIICAVLLKLMRFSFETLQKDFRRFFGIFRRLASVLIFHIAVNITFACLYQIISILDENAFNTSPNNFLDALYFSTVTITTLGYGDILPNAGYVKILVILETMLGIILLGAVLSSALSIALLPEQKGSEKCRHTSDE